MPYVTTQPPSSVTTFAIITGSQTTIPARAFSYNVSVISGGAFLNGVGPFEAGYKLSGPNQLALPLNVGGTGLVASPTKIVLSYETYASI